MAEGAVASLIPFTLDLGGKSPNIFFSDVMVADDAFIDKAVEGSVLFAFNQGDPRDMNTMARRAGFQAAARQNHVLFPNWP